LDFTDTLLQRRTPQVSPIPFAACRAVLPKNARMNAGMAALKGRSTGLAYSSCKQLYEWVRHGLQASCSYLLLL
jgi:hypothetical protein